MKIQTKILAAILILVAALAVNTLIGLHRLGKIEFELEGVAQKDVKLMELTTSVVHRQLERGILLERTIRIGEELAFEKVSEARRDHLILNAKITKDGFESLAQKGASEIIESKNLLEDLLSNQRFSFLKKDLDHAFSLVGEIEKSHIEYDRSVMEVIDRIIAGGYELSFEDIDRIQSQERMLNKKLQALLGEVQEFVEASLIRAREEQRQAVNVLWWCLTVGAVIGLLFLMMIIRDITRPLKSLVLAAKNMAAGHYDVELKVDGRDEFSELSRTFKDMSEKIAESSRQLHEQNIILESNLELTSRQKIDLEKMNRDLDELVRILSHDIRSPLTNLTGYSSVLQKEYLSQLDDRGQRCVTGIKRSTERIAQMIDDLLEMKQIVKQEARFESTNVQEILLSVQERIQYKILENKIDFQLRGPFPVIECDKTKLRIVFLNLVNNAIKFSVREPKISSRIEVGYCKRDRVHEFYVKDNGIGVDPAHHEEIFGLFKRVGGGSDADGTGVGLTVVKAIVEEHGGHIWVDSRLGQGATFYFTIPQRAA